MGSIVALEGGHYKARYRDHLGRSRSKTFRLKKDATDFLKTVGADIVAPTSTLASAGSRSPSGHSTGWRRR